MERHSRCARDKPPRSWAGSLAAAKRKSPQMQMSIKNSLLIVSWRTSTEKTIMVIILQRHNVERNSQQVATLSVHSKVQAKTWIVRDFKGAVGQRHSMNGNSVSHGETSCCPFSYWHVRKSAGLKSSHEQTKLFYIYIYSRRFYPKRLTYNTYNTFKLCIFYQYVILH